MIANLTKHPIFTNASELTEICKPLHGLNINYFSHVHIDKENKFTGLCNNARFAEHYFSNKYYEADISAAVTNKLGRMIIWDAIECAGQSRKLNEEAKAFGVEHTFTLIENNIKGGKDFYHFSSNYLGNSINQEYLKNLSLLKLFILHFQENVRASKDLQNAYNMKLSMSNNVPGFEYINSNNINHKSDDFFNKIKLNQEHSNQQLSMREIEILAWMHKGKTIIEISIILKVAEITIKKHIENIKRKTNCYTQFQLGEYFYKHFYLD